MTFIERAIEGSAWRKQQERKATERRTVPLPDAPPQSGERISFSNRTLANGGDLVTEAAQHTIFEQFRRLKRPVLQVACGPLATPGMNVLLVTSPLADVGKTFVSTNLAHMLALEKDSHVLLIDTDIAHHSLTSRLQLDDRPGFYDVIGEHALPLGEAVLETDVPGLSLLPAGKHAPDSLERLHSSRCRQFFDELVADRRYSMVVLDSPPLLQCRDGPALLTFAGQTLMVVAAGTTPKSSITAAMELLDRNKPVGLILNRAPGSLVRGHYGYSYYAYGSY